MNFKIEEQNRPKDYLINDKYRDMINNVSKYSVEELLNSKNELVKLMENYSQNDNYDEEKNYINKWILKFNDIIKTKKST